MVKITGLACLVVNDTLPQLVPLDAELQAVMLLATPSVFDQVSVRATAIHAELVETQMHMITVAF